MKRVIIIMLIAAVLPSCGSKKSLVKEVPVKTVEKVVERIVSVEVPADSSAIFALFECDSTNQVIMKELSEVKTQNSNTGFQFDKGVFKYETKVVRDTVYVKARDSIVEREIPVRVEVPVKVNILTWKQQTLIKAGYVLLALIGALTVYLIIKIKTGGLL